MHDLARNRGAPPAVRWTERVRSAVAGLAVAIACGTAAANPQGPTVAHGTATFNAAGGALNVTTSNRAIINWQQFSIGAGELTHFTQPGAASAVLNRVTGGNPSSILGRLTSNGQVVLINPHGVAFGAGAVVDTAGLIASTLGISDRNFLDGALTFDAGPDGAGKLSNAGFIKAHAGGVFLLAPRIENSGIIETENGDLVLAAGRRVTLTSLDLAGLRIEVQAPDDEALNLGALIARGGSAGLAGAVLRNTGRVEATALGRDGAGNIVLTATGDVRLEAGSTLDASDADGGSVRIESSAGTVWAEGTIESRGEAGRGGTIHLLGERVAVMDDARIDASGTAGGGQVLLGGERGGAGTTKRADMTVVMPDAEVRADATVNGDGGEIVVWSDTWSGVYGTFSARGGAQGGDGGFIETSGLAGLEIATSPDVSAPAGSGGEWLIDPFNIDIIAGGGSVGIAPAAPFPPNPVAVSTAPSATVGVNSIVAVLTGGASVTIQTGAGGGQNGSILWQAGAALDINNTVGTNTLTLLAHDGITIQGNITDSVPGGQVLNLVLDADQDNNVSGFIGLESTISLLNGNLTTDGTGVGVQGGANVTIEGGTWLDNTGSWFIGGGSTGTVTIRNGGQLRTKDGGVGFGAGGVGILNIDNASWINELGQFTFGVAQDGGTGTVNITNGGSARFNAAAAGNGGSLRVGKGTPGGVGTVNVTGSGSSIVTTGGGELITPGSFGNSVSIGNAPGTTGLLNVTQNARVETHSFEVGRDGTGIATISTGGRVLAVDSAGGVPSSFEAGFENEGGFVRAGRNAGGNGTIIVESGGRIDILNGPGKSGPVLQIARNTGSTGAVIVRGAGSTINIDQGANAVLTGFQPGVQMREGTSSLSVIDGGVLNLTGFDWFFNIGRGGTGVATVASGGHVNVSGDLGFGAIGNFAGSQGTLNITGAGSRVTMAGFSNGIHVGRFGTGALNITNGGQFNSTFINIGREASGVGTVLVDGPTSSINLSGDGLSFAGDPNGPFINVGREGTATMTVSGGADVTIEGTTTQFPGLSIGGIAGSVGNLTVTGAGSSIIINSSLNVAPGDRSALLQIGRAGTGTLDILAGGVVSNAGNGLTTVAREPGSVGTLLVDGPGSVLIAGALYLVGQDFDFTTFTALGEGSGGTAMVTESNGGSVITSAQTLNAAVTDEVLTASTSNAGTLDESTAPTTAEEDADLASEEEEEEEEEEGEEEEGEGDTDASTDEESEEIKQCS